MFGTYDQGHGRASSGPGLMKKFQQSSCNTPEWSNLIKSRILANWMALITRAKKVSQDRVQGYFIAILHIQNQS